MPDEVAEADGKERREDGLGADDFARKVYHDSISENEEKSGSKNAVSAGVAARCMELFEHSSDKVGGGSLGVGELVVEG